MTYIKKNDKGIRTIIHLPRRISKALSTMTNMTSEIVSEFNKLIEEDKVYDLKELKQILSDIYKTKTKVPKAPKKSKKSNEENGEIEKEPKAQKAKRGPTAYNLFMKEKMIEMKENNNDLKSKDIMGLVAKEWKLLSQEQKDAYKPKAVVSETEEMSE